MDGCTQSAVDHYFTVNYVDHNTLTTAEARSVQDDKVLVRYYAPQLILDLEEESGVQPGEGPDLYEGLGEYCPKFRCSPPHQGQWLTAG